MDNSDNEQDEFAELTPHQLDLLVQLQDLTGIDDLNVCRALLVSKNWDIESVAREQLGLGGSGVEPEVSDSDGDSSDQSHSPIHHVARRDNSPLSWLMYILTLPSRVINGGFNLVWSFVSSLLGIPQERQTRQASDGRTDVAEFIREYEQKFGNVHPPFNRGGYYQVLDEAKRDLRFLLVYLHSDDHQDTENFCRNVISSNEVIQQIQESNILFWSCSVRKPEGYRVSQALRETSYPFLAMIVLRQHRMVVVARQEGVIQPDALVNWIQQNVTEYEAFIVAARAERDERNLDREIRSQQEAEYAETLRRDQEREMREREREEIERREEEERERLRREELERKDQIVKMKIEMANEIPDEPSVDNADAVRIVIKLPDGQRLERRFLMTHSLKHIYYFVFCHPDSPDQFDIGTNYPRRTLPCKPSPEHPTPPSLKEAGFGKSEMLFVSDLDS